MSTEGTGTVALAHIGAQASEVIAGVLVGETRDGAGGHASGTIG